MTVLAKVMQAVYDRLYTSQQLMGENPAYTVLITLPADAMTTGVYDTVPAGTAMPFVVFGEMQEKPIPTFGKSAFEVTLTLYIWSNQADSLALLNIMEQVETSLSTDLAVTGLNIVDQRVSTRDVKRQGNYVWFIPLVLTFYVEVV